MVPPSVTLIPPLSHYSAWIYHFVKMWYLFTGLKKYKCHILYLYVMYLAICILHALQVIH